MKIFILLLKNVVFICYKIETDLISIFKLLKYKQQLINNSIIKYNIINFTYNFKNEERLYSAITVT